VRERERERERETENMYRLQCSEVINKKDSRVSLHTRGLTREWTSSSFLDLHFDLSNLCERYGKVTHTSPVVPFLIFTYTSSTGRYIGADIRHR